MQKLKLSKKIREKWIYKTALAFLLMLGAFFLLYFLYVNAEKNLRINFLRQTEMQLKTLPIESIKKLTGTEADIALKDYQKLKENLAEIRALESKIRFSYLIGQKEDGTIFFYVDNEPASSVDYSPPGQVYEEASENLKKVFLEKGALVDGPNEDRWGTWVSAFVPLVDEKNGHLIALFALDINANDWQEKVLVSIAWPVFIILACLILAIFLLFYVPQERALSSSLLYNLLLKIAFLIVILSLTFFAFLYYQHRLEMVNQYNDVQKKLNNDFNLAIKYQFLELNTLAEILFNDSTILALLKDKNQTELLKKVTPILNKWQQQKLVSQLYFIDQDENCILRVHNPTKQGGKIKHFVLEKAKETGKAAMGLEMGDLGIVSLRIAYPLWENGTLLGYLEIGKELEEILTEIENFNDTKNIMLLKKETLVQKKWEEGMLFLNRQNSWSELSKYVVSSSVSVKDLENGFRQNVLNILKKAEQNDLQWPRVVDFEQKRWRIHKLILIDVQDREIGYLLVLKNVTEKKEEFQRLIFISFLILLLLIIAFLGVVAILLYRVDCSIKKQHKELLREKENAEQASLVKGQFLANMSHEIRTPMNGMLGFLQLLKQTNLDQEQKEYLKKVDISSELLLRVINDILDISKMESGKIALENITFDLKETIYKVVVLFKDKAKEKGLVLEAFLDQDLPVQVLGDPLRLRQILTNILHNAIKFTAKGSIKLQVKLLETKEDQYCLEFFVQDTGIGMDKEKLKNIFELFFQEDFSLTRRYGGTGLGLPICKALIEMMQGQINIESDTNQGMKVTFTVLLGKVTLFKNINIEKVLENNTAKTTKHSFVLGKEVFPKKKELIAVLIVEDDPIGKLFLKKVMQTLKNNGISYDLAENGKEAVLMHSQKKYDLIFMDCQLPVLDGYTATREIRNSEAKDEHVVIIALTAHAIKGAKEECLAHGMDDYLSKPVEVTKVIETIKKYFVLD